MKYLLTICVIIVSCFALKAQCPDYISDQDGSIKINIYSESGECFKVDLRGNSLTPNSTSNLTFMVDASAKVKVTLDNGNVIEKNILLNPDIVSVYLAVQANKKGKWSLKNKLGKMEKTAESQQQWKDDLAKSEAERKAKQEKSDAEWDAARQAEKDERAAEKAKEDAEDEKAAAQRDADREARYAEQRKKEDANRPKNDLLDKKAEEEKQRQDQAKAREEELAKREAAKPKTTPKTAPSSPPTTPASPSTKPSTNSSEKSSSGSTSVPMVVTYKGRPVTDTYITLEIEKVVIGSATTDGNGRAIIKTDLPVNTEVAYKLSGKKGSAKWSFSGVFLLERLPKETKVPLEYAIKVMADAMGMSESAISNSWGLE